MNVVIFGCGYTGRRVAERLLAAGREVHATTRRAGSLDDLVARGLRVHALDLAHPPTVRAAVAALPSRFVALHSVPVVAGCGGPRELSADLVEALGDRVRRWVYLSSTGVYGLTTEVDETTPAAPETTRQRLRTQAEETLRASGRPVLVLRPAAIYGPGRGLPALLRAGRYRMVGAGTEIVSRIHVDDLAALATAGLEQELEGAWPVADEDPAPTHKVVEFWADLLGVPMPPSVDAASLGETRRTTRRVDGRAIARALGVTLRYPSSRTESDS